MYLVIIPTYNEAENIELMLNRFNNLNEKFNLLFIDDNSPDGTGKILEKKSKENKNIYIIHRKKKYGIGSAHIDGLMWAYKKNYKVVITMDCDFTHSPDQIKLFLDEKNKADLIVGSRFLDKGGLKNWSIQRKLITYFGHFLTSTLLNISYDATGAFRLYNISKIPKEIFLKINSDGYSFFFKSIFIINFNNFTIKEIPIVLSSRSAGNSKMKFSDALNGIMELFKIFILKIINNSIYKI